MPSPTLRRVVTRRCRLDADSEKKKAMLSRALHREAQRAGKKEN